jgi:hypothetical protein
MGILNKDLFTEEELNNPKTRFNLLIYWFNKYADEHPEKVDQKTYIDFYKFSNEISQVMSKNEYRLAFLKDAR